MRINIKLNFLQFRLVFEVATLAGFKVIYVLLTTYLGKSHLIT